LEGQYSEEAPQELNNNNNISDEEDSQSSEEDQKAEVLEAPQGVDIFLETLDTLALQDPSTFDILVDALIKIVRTSKIQLTKDTAVRWLLGVAQRKSTRTLVVAEVILEHTTDLLITVEVTSLLLNYAIQETTPWEDILAAAKLIFLYSTDDDAAINKAGELVCAVVNHDHATRVDHAVGMLNGVAACRSARAKTVVRGLMQQATDAWILTRLKQARQDHWSSANRRE
jgi:hypothetical protein